MQRRLLIQAAATLAGAPLLARAEDKPITLVLGFSAGSAPDIAARIIANHLPSELGGRKVIVDNRPGAGGQLAFVALKQASPDGSVLAFAPSNLLTIFPRTYSKLPYDAADVTPIATGCTVDFAFVVASNHPAKTLGEFVTWAKANPKQASIGNPGLGTAQHFLGWLFGKEAGVDLEGVPYRSTPQMAQELAGGQIAGAIAVQAVFMELVRAGRLRMLATTGETRSALFPSVPTMDEAGFASLRAVDWFAFFGPRAFPQSAVDGLAAAVRKVVQREDVRSQLHGMGLTAVAHDAQWLNKSIKADSDRWAEVVRRTGFKADS